MSTTTNKSCTWISTGGLVAGAPSTKRQRLWLQMQLRRRFPPTTSRRLRDTKRNANTSNDTLQNAAAGAKATAKAAQNDILHGRNLNKTPMKPEQAPPPPLPLSGKHKTAKPNVPNNPLIARSSRWPFPTHSRFFIHDAANRLRKRQYYPCCL